MVKKVELNNLSYVLFNDFEPFYITENDKLTLLFSSKSYDLSKAIIWLKNGLDIKAFTMPESLSLTITEEELLKVGRLDVIVDLPEHGKKWYLDGVKIKQTEDLAIKELSAIRDDYEKIIADLKARVETLENEKKNIFNI